MVFKIILIRRGLLKLLFERCKVFLIAFYVVFILFINQAIFERDLPSYSLCNTTMRVSILNNHHFVQNNN